MRKKIFVLYTNAAQSRIEQYKRFFNKYNDYDVIFWEVGFSNFFLVLKRSQTIFLLGGTTKMYLFATLFSIFKKNIIFDVFDLPILSNYKRNYKNLIKYLILYISSFFIKKYVVLSEGYINELYKLSILRKNTDVNKTFSLPLFSRFESNVKNSNIPKVIYWGNYHKHHGLSELLGVIFDYNLRNIDFIFIGSDPTGNYKKKIMMKSEKLNLENVRFLPKVDNLSEYLDSSNLYLGSLSNMLESSLCTPNKAFQSLYLGLNTVTNIHNYNSVLLSEYEGLYGIRDINEIVDVINDWRNNESKRKIHHKNKILMNNQEEYYFSLFKLWL